jgi:hypothetical protein
MPVNKNSNDYIQGANAERTRIAVRDAARAALDAHPTLPDIAREVANHLGRDDARKNRILAGSPHLAYAFDAEDLGKMSASELARYELKQLGINVSDNSDPVEVRDALHAGRLHERRGTRAISMDSAVASFVDNYLKE